MTDDNPPRLLLIGKPREGDVHVWHVEGEHDLTWCGKRLRGVTTRTTGIADDVCPTCRRAMADGRQRPWRRGR